jgi:predicted dithiol-disulfide oxidoreductase (DUF899 family)
VVREPTMSTTRFPGESAAYREARDALLQAEVELKTKTEQVAALRRRLPAGGEVPQDYAFEEGPTDPSDPSTTVRRVRLSELFGDKSTLVLYSYMYGPDMKAPCPLCTSFLDGLDAQAHHIRQSVALAVTAKSPIQRIRELARGRGWRRLRLASSAESTYQRDYHSEDDKGGQWPMMNVFVKKDGAVRHFWGSEMLYASDRNKDGMDSRHIDIMWPLWNVLDLTPHGRGETFYPSLRYEDDPAP